MTIAELIEELKKFERENRPVKVCIGHPADAENLYKIEGLYNGWADGGDYVVIEVEE